jgi:hypothetical protein
MRNESRAEVEIGRAELTRGASVSTGAAIGAGDRAGGAFVHCGTRKG